MGTNSGWMPPAAAAQGQSHRRARRDAGIFAFTQVKIGGPLEHGALKPRFDSERVRVQQVRATEMKPEDMAWNLPHPLPGFRKVAAMRRQAAPETPESLHVVFSDGLASISVFIEPGGSGGEAEAQATVGPVNVYRRQLARIPRGGHGRGPGIGRQAAW
jgi:negative regulator of sigma E activity